MLQYDAFQASLKLHAELRNAALSSLDRRECETETTFLRARTSRCASLRLAAPEVDLRLLRLLRFLRSSGIDYVVKVRSGPRSRRCERPSGASSPPRPPRFLPLARTRFNHGAYHAGQQDAIALRVAQARLKATSRTGCPSACARSGSQADPRHQAAPSAAPSAQAQASARPRRGEGGQRGAQDCPRCGVEGRQGNEELQGEHAQGAPLSLFAAL